MIRIIKSYTMPIAMVLGISFYSFFSLFSGVIPYLIFLMLLITYSKMDISEMRLKKMHLWLILIQVFGSIIVYLMLLPINSILAQGAAICVLAPTATAAPVIARMLDGNVESLTSYSLLSNLALIMAAPIYFSLIGSSMELSFLSSFINIFSRVALLLLLPLVIAFLLQKLLPAGAKMVGKLSAITFYIWALALLIVIGKTVKFIVDQGSDSFAMEIYLAFATLIIAVMQFGFGRKIGRKYNDTVAGGQGLGQKNTILVIWMTQTYLNPLASIGPGAYVLWQNMINSWQIWRKNKVNV